MAAFSRVAKAATRSQQPMLHAVVPKKSRRQSAEVATGWQRGGLALAKVKMAAFCSGDYEMSQLPFLSACRRLTVALKDAIERVFDEASLSKQIGELVERNEVK